jgi:alkaline phosphatase D
MAGGRNQHERIGCPTLSNRCPICFVHSLKQIYSNVSAMPEKSKFNRRTILKAAVSTAAATLCSPFIATRVIGQPAWSKGDPFALGVAAGDPAPDGFVLWTRLAPEPLSADPEAPGGMRGGPLDVVYEIAADAEMQNIVRQGVATAEPAFGYSVHLEVDGLQPARPYWYRFRSGDAVSRVGRAITTPEPGRTIDALRFGFVSCSNYETGYFSAYRHLADENPDLVLFLGDYIYEDLFRRAGAVRRHSDGVAATTLPTYRNRYAQYRLDPDLQRLHAEVPALMTWDDHEVQNDYADRWSETFDDPNQFLLRRAAAYQAFYEHMPLRPGLSRPQGPVMRVYDRVRWGDLLEFAILDGRQYRSREACYGPPKKGGGHLETREGCPELFESQRSMIGLEQEAWLFEGWTQSQSRWNVLAQDVLMARLREKEPNGELGYWTDDWDGYPVSRGRLLQHIHDSKLQNPVVIGGDIHSFWANDLMLDFDDAHSAVVATELVGTSISSPGPNYEQFVKFLPDNPHVKFFDSRVRGYVAVQVSPAKMDIQFRAISDVTDPNASVSTLRSFSVEDGRPGVVT